MKKNKCNAKKCKRVARYKLQHRQYCEHCFNQLNVLMGGNLKHQIIKKKKRQKKQDALKEYAIKEQERAWKERVFASWKDTPEQQKIRLSPEYQEWRKIVLERDNYTCQHCQKTGGKLVVHHIKTFKMNPELRINPDNGVVLCNNCHEELHLSRMKKPKVLRIINKTG